MDLPINLGNLKIIIIRIPNKNNNHNHNKEIITSPRKIIICPRIINKHNGSIENLRGLF